MPRLLILVGPPCSGKSTYTKKLLRSRIFYRNFYRVNQDNIRNMLKMDNQNYWDTMTRQSESVVYSLNNDTIGLLLDKNFNVILDNTNCNLPLLKGVINTYKDRTNITFVLFEEKLWKLKLRNIIRYFKTKGKIWIPVKVLENMYKNFYIVKEYLVTNHFDQIEYNE